VRTDQRIVAGGDEGMQLAALVEHVPVGIVMVDRGGGVQMTNDRALRMLGERVISLRDGEHPLQRALRAGEIVDNERMRIVRPDGSTIAIHVSAAPVRDSGGRVIGAVGFFQNLAERERHERAGRDFVTNAAHQLQSPLAGIISAVEVLQAGAKHGPERDVFLGHIERESHRLARLARALLILARAQTGLETPRDEIVALEPLLAEIGASLRPAAGVGVDVRCPPELAVITNRELIEQALMNLAENATKYTTEGRITLAARLLGRTAEIVVSDTGPGIPEREQARVLDRFYRVTPNGSEGFGLGFAIVKSAVQALDGELEVGDAEGGGTVVRIRLQQAASLVESS
jgi:two-component system sensor histidine kinase VicK